MTSLTNYRSLWTSLLLEIIAIVVCFAASGQEFRKPNVEWNLPQVAVPNASAAAEADMNPYTETIPGTDVKFDMVPIKGGEFLMGSSEQEQKDQGGEAEPEYFYDPAAEGPQHKVQVSPFWMGKCEVTWDEYLSWLTGRSAILRKEANEPETPNTQMADAIPCPSACAYTDMTCGMGTKGYPVINVTPFAAKLYCKWLTAITGRLYRLPTEAEWEYACRAGTTGAYSFDVKDIDDYAVYYGNSSDKYAKVGSKKPNPWGLYDMHGNVWEMCLDKYEVNGYKKLIDAADGKTLADPLNPAEGAEYKVVFRGGSWDDDPERLRSAARWASHKDWKMQDPQIPPSICFFTDACAAGFRVVRPLTPIGAVPAKEYEPDLKILDEYLKGVEKRK